MELGCQIEPLDDRDLRYEIIAGGTGASLPESFVISPEWTWNQKNIDSCVGHACALAKSVQEEKELSPRHAWSHGKKKDEYLGWGTAIYKVLNGIVKHGLVEYGDISESSSVDRKVYMHVKLTEEQQGDAKENAASSYWRAMDWGTTDQALLDRRIPLVTSMMWSVDYNKPVNGVIRPSNNKSYGHAFVYCGWKVKDGQKYRIFKNSWGENWGDNGYFYILDEEKDMFGLGGKYVILDIPLTEAKLISKYRGKLIKNPNDPAYFYVGKEKVAWIKNEVAFDFGRANGWWGDWGTVTEIEDKINYSLTF